MKMMIIFFWMNKIERKYIYFWFEGKYIFLFILSSFYNVNRNFEDKMEFYACRYYERRIERNIGGYKNSYVCVVFF